VDNAVHTKVHDIPANPSEILHKDPQGSERKHSWNYRAIVGALTYLMAMARPELAYAVHQCSRFSNDPKQSHEHAIKRIWHYLKLTQDHGLIIDPDLSKGFECYVDADWAGNWNKNFPDVPYNVYSRTGYVISYSDCPIVWASNMQTLIALSTNGAELIALSTTLHEVIHLMNLVKELSEQGIPVPFMT